MAQQPTSGAYAPASLVLYRDAVVQEALGAADYSALSATKKSEVDLEGNSAFMEVTELCKWFTETEVDPSDTDLPIQFNELFRVKWVERLIRRFRTVVLAEHYARHATRITLQLISTYTANWSSSSFLQTDDSITPEMCRRAVMLECVRQRSPVFVPIIAIDQAIRAEFVRLWNARKWEFRKREVQVTLAMTGAVEISPTVGFGFDSMASTSIVVDGNADDQQLGVWKIEWVGADKIIEARVAYGTTPGKPRVFYDIDEGYQKTIGLLPIPDIDYTGHAVIYISAPDFAGLASADGIKLLPPEFRRHLIDSTVATLLSKWGREDVDAARSKSIVMDERERLALEWDDKGASRFTTRSRPNIDLIQSTASYDGTGIIGSY